MKVFQRFWEVVSDSPTYLRDRANLLTGFTIGITALMLNGIVMLFVTPFLSAPVNSGIAEQLDFGQLMGLVLLGGASAFATFLIPLRLATVFWEPRLGRYFDQVVISGISPLRYVIGKALSQNLFLGLILFLLIPYFVLSLALGGVDFRFFLACLFLVWLYCMSLALATLWASLYVNDLVAALVVMVVAATIAIMGCNPWTMELAILSPFPALFQPLYAAIPTNIGIVPPSFPHVFASCAIAMSAFSVAALFAIALGPLYGIVSENSTFGEVVREGDARRKRWFRVRVHIQRPSEISFFYVNRSAWFTRWEALIRWGVGFAVLVFLLVISELILCKHMLDTAPSWGKGPEFARFFHIMVLTIHGIALLLAIAFFSHSRNTTYLKLPIWRNRTITVSKLDSRAFLLFLIVSTFASIYVPDQFEREVAIPHFLTVFPIGLIGNQWSNTVMDCYRISWEGTAIISVSGFTLYKFQRTALLGAWLKSATLLIVCFLYFILIAVLPFMLGAMVLEIDDLRRIELLKNCVPTIAATSPMTALGIVFQGDLGGHFPKTMTTIPFYVLHAFLFVGAMIRFRQLKQKLLPTYLPSRSSEARHV